MMLCSPVHTLLAGAEGTRCSPVQRGTRCSPVQMGIRCSPVQMGIRCPPVQMGIRCLPVQMDIVRFERGFVGGRRGCSFATAPGVIFFGARSHILSCAQTDLQTRRDRAHFPIIEVDPNRAVSRFPLAESNPCVPRKTAVALRSDAGAELVSRGAPARFSARSNRVLARGILRLAAGRREQCARCRPPERGKQDCASEIRAKTNQNSWSAAQRSPSSSRTTKAAAEPG